MEINGLRERLEKLGSVAELLNKYSDELNVQIKEIEKAISQLNLGIFARVPLLSKTDSKVKKGFIGYGRSTNGAWGIFLDSEDELSRWAFRDAPRHLRITAIDFIPDLIEGLANCADVTTKRIEKKIPIAREMAEAILRAEEEIKSEAQPK